MPVTFILGRAGTGKTRRCLDALLAELSKPDETRRLILLVPEQASFQMERTLALRAPRHGYWRAEVLSFSRLARRVFEQAGREPQMLRPTARALALRCVAGAAKEELREFGASARRPGFFAQLDRLIEELLAENVTANAITEVASKLGDAVTRERVAALARVYRDYLDWLGPERIDPAQQLGVLRQRLTQLEWLREASVWVDGFAGFTGQELETLVTLAGTAREVAITLLLDPAAPAVQDPRHPPDLLNLFCRTETTYQRLIQRLAEEGVELDQPVVLQPAATPRFARAETLKRLEAGLATPIGATSDPRCEVGQLEGPAAAQVRLLECETHRDELRAAARFIRQQVMESNGALRFRDFAVIARDLEPFVHSVADVFAEYELPCFLDRRRSLRVHALARFVQALLDTVVADFSTDAMTRLLRCGLLPLSRAQAETLENQIVADEIRGLEAWRQRRWTSERKTSVSQPDADTLGAARVRVVAALETLVQLAQADSAPTGAKWARGLHATLAALRIPERIDTWIAQAKAAQDWETAEVHRLAWDALCGVLEDLHDVLGDRSIELADVAAIVGSALDELTVALAPPTLDQVLVSSIERSRHPNIKYAWVFAFNEGIFPTRPGDDALLSTADRESLTEAGLAAVHSRRDDVFAERMLAYIALTRPSHGLTISYAKVGDDGGPQFASPLLDEVMRALPTVTVEKVAQDQPPVCLSEFADGYLGARSGQPRPDASWRRHERLRGELSKSSELSGRLERLLRGLAYRNSPAPVRGYSRPSDLDPKVAWSGSPSELETYLDCPFKHFVLYGLSLSPQRGPLPVNWDLGDQAHQIMAAVTERAIAAPQPVAELSDDQWLTFLSDVIEGSATRRPVDLAERRPQAAFLGNALQPFLRELVLAHAERWRRGAFEPLACERRFGSTHHEQGLDALELATDGGERIRLRGVVDRIDHCKHEGRTYLLVYDYKSSLRNIKTGYLTRDRLQLFTYLLAVAQALGTKEKAQAAGVFLAPLYPDVRVIGRKYAADASPAEMRMYLYHPRGLFDAAVARLLDQQLDEHPSPVAAMRLKKDGGFHASSDARPAHELDARLELARRTILLAAAGIIDGRVDVAPLVENNTLACRNCEFGALCRFDPIFNRPRVPETSLPTLGQLAANASGGLA